MGSTPCTQVGGRAVGDGGNEGSFSSTGSPDRGEGGEREEEFLPVVSVLEGARVTSSTAESGGSLPPRRSPVTLGDKPMEDPGVGLSFTFDVP